MLPTPVATMTHDASCPTAWYAIYARHQHEKTVAQILTIKGFETLLPLYQSARRWKDRTKVLSLPLFPCYIFVKGGLERRLDILTTPGIYAFVSIAGHPTSIPSAEIEAIQRIVESGARMEPHPFLKCGDSVRVKWGPLAGIQGILVRKKDVCRLVLSVEMLGQAAALEVDSLLVERLNGEHRENYTHEVGVAYKRNNARRSLITPCVDCHQRQHHIPTTTGAVSLRRW
jgi:transcription antitermination factor NusG